MSAVKLVIFKFYYKTIYIIYVYVMGKIVLVYVQNRMYGN